MIRLIRTLGLLVPLSCTAVACHLVLDPGEFRLEYDAGPDAPPPDAALPDVNEQALALGVVEPAQVFEGQGSFAGGPGVAILVHGTDIAPNATVSVSGVAGVVIEQVHASADGSTIGAVLRIPVDDTRPEGADQTLTLTVEQGDPKVSQTTTVLVKSLDELVLVAQPNPSTFKPRYSRITSSGITSLRGGSIARLVATGSIAISTKLDADATNNATGAGGCAGGGANQDGMCGTGGGRAGGSAATLSVGGGGGGGGSSVMGINGGAGSGGAGGDGGEASISALASFAVPLVGGNGGGGGGTGQAALGLGTAGGPGANAGGGLELFSEGEMTVSSGVSANGGNGTTAGGGCTSGGGGGGGGAGGTLLLRAAGAMTVMAAPLRASGGNGGNASAASGCGNRGGAGAPGVIRLDAPAGSISGVDAMPAAVRGPMLAPDTAQIVSTRDVELTLFGSANHEYGYNVGSGGVLSATTDADGKATFTVTLPPRMLTNVCTFVSPSVGGDQINLPEAKNCRVLVYIP